MIFLGTGTVGKGRRKVLSLPFPSSSSLEAEALGPGPPHLILLSFSLAALYTVPDLLYYKEHQQQRSLAMSSRGGRANSAPWSRLKPVNQDPLEAIGLPSKGDNRYVDALQLMPLALTMC